jgi:hypothetical protein
MASMADLAQITAIYTGWFGDSVSTASLYHYLA